MSVQDQVTAWSLMATGALAFVSGFVALAYLRGWIGKPKETGPVEAKLNLNMLRAHLPSVTYPCMWESYYDSSTGEKLLHVALVQGSKVHAQFVSHEHDIHGAVRWAQRERNKLYGGVTDYDMTIGEKDQ